VVNVVAAFEVLSALDESAFDDQIVAYVVSTELEYKMMFFCEFIYCTTCDCCCPSVLAVWLCCCPSGAGGGDPPSSNPGGPGDVSECLGADCSVDDSSAVFVVPWGFSLSPI
jgi:hypothetical protein